jgi:hypothetical protein
MLQKDGILASTNVTHSSTFLSPFPLILLLLRLFTLSSLCNVL